MKSLFKIENHLLVLDKDYLRGINEFKVILERQYKVDGDADGRKKKYNYQLFYYIMMIADLFCYPNKEGLSDKDAHIAACKEAKLPEDFKPDKEIKEAIVKYREIQLSELPALGTLSTVLKGLKTSDTLCKRIIKNIESKIQKLESDEIVNIAEEQIIIEGAVAQLNTVIKISNSLPDTIETLEKLEERIRRESSGEVLARGGKKIGNRAE